jgi:hypothetical protein
VIAVQDFGTESANGSYQVAEPLQPFLFGGHALAGHFCRLPARADRTSAVAATLSANTAVRVPVILKAANRRDRGLVGIDEADLGKPASPYKIG